LAFGFNFNFFVNSESTAFADLEAFSLSEFIKERICFVAESGSSKLSLCV